MRIALAADHAGFEMKQTLVAHLRDAGHDVDDLGTDSPTSVDYPDFGAAVGNYVAKGEAELGIAVCGTGIGIGIAANKVDGVRAAMVTDVTGARLCREHNDANVLCLGERLIGMQVAIDAVDAFVSASFEGGRHQRRIDKIRSLEA